MIAFSDLFNSGLAALHKLNYTSAIELLGEAEKLADFESLEDVQELLGAARLGIAITQMSPEIANDPDQLIAKGNKCLELQDYKEADRYFYLAANLLLATEGHPSAKLFLSLERRAQTSLRLKDYENAYDNMLMILSEGGADVTPELLQSLVELKQRLATSIVSSIVDLESCLEKAVSPEDKDCLATDITGLKELEHEVALLRLPPQAPASSSTFFDLFNNGLAALHKLNYTAAVKFLGEAEKIADSKHLDFTKELLAVARLGATLTLEVVRDPGRLISLGNEALAAGNNQEANRYFYLASIHWGGPQ